MLAPAAGNGGTPASPPGSAVAERSPAAGRPAGAGAAPEPAGRTPARSFPGGTSAVWLGALMLAAAALRAFRLGFQSFWLDEAHTAFYAADQSLALLWARLQKPGENGPLYYFLLAPWLHRFGGGEASLRAFSVLASLPAIPLCYFTLQRLAGRRVARLGTLLFAFAPYQTWYAREAKMYALLLSATLAALALFLLALEHGRWWRWALYSLAALASVFVHFFALLAIASHGALALWLARRHRQWRRLLAAALAIGVVVVPVLGLELLAIRRDVAGSGRLGGFSLAEQAGILLYAFTLNTAPLPLPMVLLAATTLLLIGSAIGTLLPPLAGGPDAPPAGRSLAPVALLCWTPLLAYALASRLLTAALFADRYFIFVTPWFDALLAAALLWLHDRWRLAGALGLGVVAVAWAYGNLQPQLALIKQDYREAMAEVNRELQPGDAIVPVPAPMAFPIGYYARTPPSFLYAETLGDSSGDAEVERWVAGHTRVWIIGTAGEDWPLVQRFKPWLDRHGRLERAASFPGGVHLWRYALSPPAPGPPPAS